MATQATLTIAPNFSDGQNPTIVYSNPSGTAVTALEAGIFASSGVSIGYRVVDKTKSSYTFVLTESEWQQLRNAASDSNSIGVTFTLRTKIGNTYYTSSLSRTFSIGDANPIVTATVIDVDAVTTVLTGDPSKLIKYFSDARVTMTAEAQKGAAIDNDMYVIRSADGFGYGKTHTFENIESNVFMCSAQDSRGNVGNATVIADMIEYVKPTCNLANNKPDGNGDMTVVVTGNFFNGSFGARTNELSVQYRYGLFGGSAVGGWNDMTVTKNGNSYVATAHLSGLDYQQLYVFEARVNDSLTTVSSAAAAVKGKPMFHWGENDFVFEVPVEFKKGTTGEGQEDGSKTIDGNLDVTGDLRLKGDGNFGNTIRFGDKEYVYLTEYEDDNLMIRASQLHLNAASGVYINGEGVPRLYYGIWTPSLAMASSYTTQYGWYMKMNQSVTVGFIIKAYCPSGYHSTAISISGLPFTPMFTAAGGGMCSGAYVNSGWNFQCFAVGTDGRITTRVQECNHATSKNLGTSASGIFYPNGGGEITLSGTITFIANS